MSGERRRLTTWVRARDPSYTMNGDLYVDPDRLTRWDPVAVLPPDECRHAETMCLNCAPTWEDDFDVRATDPRSDTSHDP